MKTEDSKNSIAFLDPATIPTISDLKAALDYIRYETEFFSMEKLLLLDSREIIIKVINHNVNQIKQLAGGNKKKISLLYLPPDIDWFPDEKEFNEKIIDVENYDQCDTKINEFEMIQESLKKIIEVIETKPYEGCYSLNEVEEEEGLCIEAYSAYLNELNRRIFGVDERIQNYKTKSEIRIRYRDELNASLPADTKNRETVLDEMTAKHFNVDPRTVRRDKRMEIIRKINFRKV